VNSLGGFLGAYGGSLGSAQSGGVSIGPWDQMAGIGQRNASELYRMYAQQYAATYADYGAPVAKTSSARRPIEELQAEVDKWLEGVA
jgi:hypothetical protein